MSLHKSSYLLIEDVVIELHFDKTAPADPLKACRQWLARQAVPVVRRGRGGRLMVKRAVLATFLEAA